MKTIRWGIVGTGGIANALAGMIKLADVSEIGAVSSRRMETAQAFAQDHDVSNAFDSWQEMVDSGLVDAMYVATPTSVREEICIAAAKAGKHVLGEKPFASLPSVRRITEACRDNNVAFMDGTHFVHHPRTLHIKQSREDALGFVWSVASAFQFNLEDRGNIRFNPELEPMGAIGDAGWYNMRAAVVMDLRITGTEGVINIDDFLGQNQDGSADFLYRKGGWGGEQHIALLQYEGKTQEAAEVAIGLLDRPRDTAYLPAVLRAIRDHFLNVEREDDAIEAYRSIYPELLLETPNVNRSNLQAAVDLVLLLQEAGETADASFLAERTFPVLDDTPVFATFGKFLLEVELHAILGERDKAIDALSTIVDSGWTAYVSPNNRNLASIASDPDYLRLMDVIRQRTDAERAKVREMEENGLLARTPEDLANIQFELGL